MNCLYSSAHPYHCIVPYPDVQCKCRLGWTLLISAENIFRAHVRIDTYWRSIRDISKWLFFFFCCCATSQFTMFMRRHTKGYDCADVSPCTVIKGNWNGTVSRNNRKKVTPCECFNGHVKEPYKMSKAWGPTVGPTSSVRLHIFVSSTWERGARVRYVV